MAATDAIPPATIGRKMINIGIKTNKDKSIETSVTSFGYKLECVMCALCLSFSVL